MKHPVTRFAKYDCKCDYCGNMITTGDKIKAYDSHWFHAECGTKYWREHSNESWNKRTRTASA